MNTNKFKARIIENGLSVAKVARQRGENPATLYRKMKTGRVTFEDVAFYSELLGLTPEDAKSIFLGK